MLTKHEAFLVRELVREQAQNIKECIRLIEAKSGIELNIHLLKLYQEELKRYEVIYNKLLEEAGNDF